MMHTFFVKMCAGVPLKFYIMSHGEINEEFLHSMTQCMQDTVVYCLIKCLKGCVSNSVKFR